MPYRTVAILIKAFNEGRQSVADMHRPSIIEEDIFATLMGSDQRQTVRELTRRIGFVQTTVLQILMERLSIKKLLHGGFHII